MIDPYRTRFPFAPADVFKAAAHSVALKTCLSLWENGDLRWDEALAYAVVMLARENERLNEAAVTRLRMDPGPIPAEFLKAGKDPSVIDQSQRGA